MIGHSLVQRFAQHKIAWSTMVQIVGKLVQLGIGFLTIRLVTQALGPEEYGIYGKIAEYALFFSAAANLGIFGNTVRKMSENPKDGRLFFNALLLRMGTAFAFLGLSGLYALFTIDDFSFNLGVLFYLFALFLDYATSVCDALLQAHYKMGRATAALIMGRLSNLLLILILTQSYETGTAPFFFLGPLFGALITAGLSLYFVRRQISWIWEIDAQLLKTLLWTSLPFGIINIFNSLYFRFLPSYFASQSLSDSQFASYTVSLHLATTASLLSTFLMFSSLPELKQALRDKQEYRIKDLLKMLSKSLLTAGILLVLAGTWLAPLLIETVSGKAFIVPELWFVFPLLLILAAISYFYDLVLITLFALEHDLWFLKREAVALTLAVGLLTTSLFMPQVELKITMVLVSAIAAESLIVALGAKKIRSLVRY